MNEVDREIAGRYGDGVKRSILFVDDNRSVLGVFRHVIAFLHQDWNGAFAPNGKEALDLMARQHFDCVVSDLSMPVMGGLEFLAEVERRYPATVRFVFSGETDTAAGLKLLGSAHQVFSKPGDYKAIKTAIDRVYSIRNILPDDALLQITGKVKILPSLPELYVQMTQELEKDEPSVERIQKLISSDVAMSAKLLHVVNSAFFGLRQGLASPAQAVTMLGLNLVKSIVLMMHVFQEQEKARFAGLDLNYLWHHSFATSQMARKLAEVEGMGKGVAEHVASSVLFHDIGKLVLLANQPEACAQIFKAVKARQGVLPEIEKEILGATHAQVGGYLLGLWGFDDMYVNVCRFHHDPALSGETCLGAVSLSHVANVFDHIRNPDKEGGKPLVLDDGYLARLGVTDRVAVWRQLLS